MLAIPVNPAEASSIQTVRLAEVDYRVRLDWHELIGKWSITISLKDGTPLVTGVTLEPMRNILKTAKVKGTPIDRLFLLTGQREDLARYDLGKVADIIMLDEPLSIEVEELEVPTIE